MKHLVIRNVGPISNVDITLRRFNFIIGPQSSGKSTIAKVLSTCEWVEKEVAITRDESAICNGDEFRNLVENFHKIEEYFDNHTSSYVLYETDYITIEYENKKLTIKLNRNNQYHRQKICYIPAERNMVTLPELTGFEFGNNNLRSFLFDWYRAREFYNKQNKTDILSLGVQYYYDNDLTVKRDRIQHINGSSYNISLSNSSSGLQSIIPLVVMLQYYTNQYFTEFNVKNSFEQNAKIKKMRSALTKEIALPLFKEEGFNEDEIPSLITEFNELLHKGDKKVNEIFEKYDKACDMLITPDRTSFIIEEPEQNLFPYTQIDLIEDIVLLCSSDRKHEFTITTHSPFILNYLNVLIMRHYKNTANKARINPDDMTVFATQDGRLIDLMETNSASAMRSVNSSDLVEAMEMMYTEYITLKNN